MLSVNGLSFTKNGKTILDDVTLQAESGELCALVGKSGSGKSVLLSVLSGRISGYSGEIAVNENIVSGRYLKKNVLHFPGSVVINGADTVRNIVISARIPYKKFLSPLSPFDWQTADEYIEIMGLEPYQNTSAETLPDALYKKTLLAYSFTREAGTLLLDNPSEGLDPSGVFDFERALKRFASKGFTVIFATNDLNLASRISDRILIMREGKIEISGGAELLTEESIREYFSAETIVSKSVYNGKPEIIYIPGN